MSLSRPWLALVIPLLCLPLFVGLGRADIEHDEAIYSFAVDRTIETGDWLEPKAIPSDDFPFLEKPPLKFWIVAAPIRLGLLPHNEFGMRFWDALFGSLSFFYVFLIGRRLAGAFCGVSAVLVLVAHDPLVFEHGLRSNNMEAALLLAYCGGIWHYMAWLRSDAVAARRRHIAAVAVYFFLGFMTKFVAVAFLPAILGLVTVLSRTGRHALVLDWRGWLVASAVTFSASAPWFIWASSRHGWFLWETILGAHVYTRFTAYLDPSHLQPWHYYFTTVFARFAESGQQWLAIAGFATLMVLSGMRRTIEGWTIVLWAVVPLVAISFGTSKIYHYVYPFLPPLALGIGYLAALLLMVGVVPFQRGLRRAQARLAQSAIAGTLARSLVRRSLVTISVVALVVAALTVLVGSVHVEWHGRTVFKSSGLFRPLAIAMLFGLLGGVVAGASRVAAVILVSSLLPIAGYRDSWSRIGREKHPIREARDCVLDVGRRVSGAGLYVDVMPPDLTHGLYYYFRRVRPWERADAPSPVALGTLLADAARPRPMLVLDSTYQTFMRGAGPLDGVRTRTESPPMRVFPPSALLLLPGPYAVCASEERPASGRR